MERRTNTHSSFFPSYQLQETDFSDSSEEFFSAKVWNRHFISSSVWRQSDARVTRARHAFVDQAGTCWRPGWDASSSRLFVSHKVAVVVSVTFVQSAGVRLLLWPARISGYESHDRDDQRHVADRRDGPRLGARTLRPAAATASAAVWPSRRSCLQFAPSALLVSPSPRSNWQQQLWLPVGTCYVWWEK